MSTELAQRECTPCTGGVPPLGLSEINELLPRLNGWLIEHEYHLTRTVKLPNFALALELTNRIGAIAEQQHHHPDIHLAWGLVKIDVWTHKISGLTESDFIFAAKVDDAIAGLMAE